MNVPAAQLEDFAKACQKVSKYGLLQCSSGNMSQRLADGNILLSASGSWLGEITTEQICVCDMQGNVLNNVKPTVEKMFHVGILQRRSDVNVVLHFQSPYATAIACGECRDIDFNCIIEVPFYIGTPAFVDFFAPGSQELADAVVEAAKAQNMVILKNHGLVTMGRDADDAIQRACFFELACQILLTGKNIKTLSPQNAQIIKAMRKV